MKNHSTCSQHIIIKHQHWRAFSGIFASKSAPMLVFMKNRLQERNH